MREFLSPLRSLHQYEKLESMTMLELKEYGKIGRSAQQRLISGISTYFSAILCEKFYVYAFSTSLVLQGWSLLVAKS